MKNFRFLWILLIGTAIPAFAQTRQDIRLYIPPIVAFRSDHAVFFMNNFAMEAVGGGYTLANNTSNADYILKLEVKPNTILYDDGVVELAPPGEKQFSLQVSLFRNEDNAEIVSFSYLFTELDEVKGNIFSIFYETMANVPTSDEYIVLEPEVVEVVRVEEVVKVEEVVRVEEVVIVEEVIKEVVIPESDAWRNKWLYFRTSADFPLTYYQAKTDGYPRSDKVIIVPGLTMGVEWQFLDWMSAELDLELRFADALAYTFIPGVGFQLKFPFKPYNNFMLEPYLAASSALNYASHSVFFPRLGLGGGFQFGVKTGSSGALFLDVNFIYSIEETRTKNTTYANYPSSAELHWNRFVVGMSIGYKIGFWDRH